MSTFKFNFRAESEAHGPQDKTCCGRQNAACVTELPAEEVQYIPGDISAHNFELIELDPYIQIYKRVTNSQAASASLENTEDLVNSDLVPHKYEGGFKVWECAIDLAQFLCQHWGLGTRLPSSILHSGLKDRPLAGQRALELGCGHGIPGILAVLHGMVVHFQDYNREVLTEITMPNVQSNLEQLPDRGAGLRFFGGSWSSLKGLLHAQGLSGSYDTVFSTDTIYSADSQQPLLECIAEALKQGGVAFIGAKSYYFGVGGSTAGFLKLAEASGQFVFQRVALFNDGASNVREIFTLKKN